MLRYQNAYKSTCQFVNLLKAKILTCYVNVCICLLFHSGRLVRQLGLKVFSVLFFSSFWNMFPFTYSNLLSSGFREIQMIFTTVKCSTRCKTSWVWITIEVKKRSFLLLNITCRLSFLIFSLFMKVLTVIDHVQNKMNVHTSVIWPNYLVLKHTPHNSRFQKLKANLLFIDFRWEIKSESLWL